MMETNEQCGECKFHSQRDEDGFGECSFLSGQSEGRVMSEGTVKTPDDFSCSGFVERENEETEAMGELLGTIEGEINSDRFQL